MSTLNSNSISGITTTSFDSTDIVNKDYVDNYPSPLPSQTGNEGKFLTTTDGTSTSWDYVSNYEEFTTPGINTFNVPSYSNLLHIEAVGAGGGGNAGQTTAQAGVTWTLRTSGNTANTTGLTFGNGIFVGSVSDSGRLNTSTNAIQWTLRTSGSNTSQFSTIAFGNNFFLAGSSTYFVTSTDAIVWTARTTGTGSGIQKVIYNGSNLYVAYNSTTLIVSTDSIIWRIRTTGAGGSGISSIGFGNGIYLAGWTPVLYASTDTITWTARTALAVVGGQNYNPRGISFLPDAIVKYFYSGQNNSFPGTIVASTDSIIWSLRTVPSISTNASVSKFIFSNQTYFCTYETSIAVSTDSIIWILRTSGVSGSITDLIYENNLNTYAFSTSNGEIVTSYSQASGAGGGSGSYTSWYIPKAIVSSNLTVNPGVGGTGATTDAALGLAGAGTTISWTGPGGTYTLTASGGGAAGVAGTIQAASQSSSFYSTAGLSGAPTSIGSGITATTQTNQFQPTSGGSGAGSTSSSGGSGGTINVYGISTSASGGDNTGTNGTNAVVISGLPYGYGGGGGGASVSIAATGGNGARGGGGGGGASIGSTFGNGGNGGDGYVKITWW